jgi:hypothetical protein
MREKEIARDNICRRLINYSSARTQLIRRRIKENARIIKKSWTPGVNYANKSSGATPLASISL